MRIAILLPLLLSGTAAHAQQAGDDVIIMRKQLTEPRAVAPGGGEQPDTPARTYAWHTGEWSPEAPGCSETLQRTRTVSCRDDLGADVAPSLCAGEAPDATLPYSDLSTCTYGWTAGSWSQWHSTCSPKARRMREVTCDRLGGPTPVEADDRLCTEIPPAKSEYAPNYSSCIPGVRWEVGPFEIRGACNPTDRNMNGWRTPGRDVTCMDGANAISDTSCTNAGLPKPATSAPAERCTILVEFDDHDVRYRWVGDETIVVYHGPQEPMGASSRMQDECQTKLDPQVEWYCWAQTSGSNITVHGTRNFNGSRPTLTYINDFSYRASSRRHLKTNNNN